MHNSSLARRADSYEHVDPAEVGNTTRLLVSELMGRSAVLSWAEERGVDIDADTASGIVASVKALEHQGYLFEAADGSFELLVRRALGWEQDFFEVESFRTLVDDRPDGVLSEATVKLVVEGERVMVTEEGDGPVNALDRALRGALSAAPGLHRVVLVRVEHRDVVASPHPREQFLEASSHRYRPWLISMPSPSNAVAPLARAWRSSLVSIGR